MTNDRASSDSERSTFLPLTVNALYPGITRGLTADLLSTQALGGRAYPICTTHVVAGRGTVTDVLTVPTDTVSAQLEHVFDVESPSAAKVGIVGDAATVEVIFRHVDEHLDGPVLLDLTLSGPSGEDIIGQRGIDAFLDRLSLPSMVSLRRTDATLLAGMEIPSLDDAQVAVQRIVQQGAQRVLLRCGRLPTHFFETDAEPPPYAVDLYYDGEDFALFEAPFIDNLETLHGASSGLLLSLLARLQSGFSFEEAMQHAKARVTEALRSAQLKSAPVQVHDFFDALMEDPQTKSSNT